MATPVGQGGPASADSGSYSLGEGDLSALYEMLSPVAEKYRNFGLQINVSASDIEVIPTKHTNPHDCLLKILETRLKQIPSLTWRDIHTALRSDTVGEPQLADRIRRQYGHLYEGSLVQEQGRKMSEMTKKERSSRKYTQQDSDEEVSEAEKYRKPSKKLQMNVNEAVVKKSQKKGKKYLYTKSHSMSGKQYIEKEMKREGETLDKPEQVLKKQYEVVIAKHRQPTTVERESENSASGSEEEQSHTPEPKRNIIPAVKYSNENTETMVSVRKPGKTAGRPSEFIQKADRKRKLPKKHQLTPKHVRLEHFSATSGEESPSNHSGTEMSIDKSSKTSAEQSKYADNSDVKAEQHDAGRRKRVYSDSPPGSTPTSQGGTQSDLKSKTRATKYQRHLKRVKRQRIKQESSSSSETDGDSSLQESDMLRYPTESENKGLIKAFKRCFGKLCLAIKDPDKAAAELQARHLLSCSMMENLLTSPESHQEKAITLVRALKKRIKSCPVRVFTLIEVFLQHEILKEAARELWNETGTQTSHFPDSTEVNVSFF